MNIQNGAVLAGVVVPEVGPTDFGLAKVAAGPGEDEFEVRGDVSVVEGVGGGVEHVGGFSVDF